MNLPRILPWSLGIIVGLAAVQACSDAAKATGTAAGGSGPENTFAACGDGVDNDQDGHTDCADQDCANAANCASKLDATSQVDSGEKDALSGADSVDVGADAGADAGGKLDDSQSADSADTAADVTAQPLDSTGDSPEVDATIGDAQGSDVPGEDTGPVDANVGDVAVSDTGLTDTGLTDGGVVDSGVVDSGPIDTSAQDLGITPDVANVCSGAQAKRCWVECAAAWPTNCTTGDPSLAPRIPGVQSCSGGQWGTCIIQGSCAALAGTCNPGLGGKPADQVPAGWKCLDGTPKSTYFGCSGVLGLACQGLGYFINWPIHDCPDFCADETCAVGASEPCEVFCNSSSGPTHSGTRTCMTTSCGSYWGQCFPNEACQAAN